jgi:hypothetical protein
MLAACTFAPHSAGDTSHSDAPLITAVDAAIDAREPIDAPSTIDASTIDATQMATVSFIQGNFGIGNNAATVKVSMPNPATAGDLDVVSFSWNDDNVTVVSVADTDANTFTEVGNALVVANVGGIATFVAPNIKSGVVGDQILITFSDRVSPVALAAEYRGLAPANVVDGTSSQSGFSSSPDSNNFTTQHPHDLIVGFGASFQSMTAGTGFTERFTGVDMLEDDDITAPATVHTTGKLGNANTWLMQGFALKADD